MRQIVLVIPVQVLSIDLPALVPEQPTPRVKALLKLQSLPDLHLRPIIQVAQQVILPAALLQVILAPQALHRVIQLAHPATLLAVVRLAIRARVVILPATPVLAVLLLVILAVLTLVHRVALAAGIAAVAVVIHPAIAHPADLALHIIAAVAVVILLVIAHPVDLVLHIIAVVAVVILPATLLLRGAATIALILLQRNNFFVGIRVADFNMIRFA